MLYYEKGG